jgi:hypothetical protein
VENNDVANKFNDLVTAHIDSLDPSKNVLASILDNKDITVATLNCSSSSQQSMPPPLPFVLTQSIAATACSMFGHPWNKYLNAIMIASTYAIADTVATSIFIMDSIDVVNKRVTNKP